MKVTAKIPVSERSSSVRVGYGANWVVSPAQGTVQKVSPASNKVVQVYGPPSGSGSVTVGPGGVWISAHNVKTVWRLPLPHH
jgi:virginiamycin B lyase